MNFKYLVVAVTSSILSISTYSIDLQKMTQTPESSEGNCKTRGGAYEDRCKCNGQNMANTSLCLEDKVVVFENHTRGDANPSAFKHLCRGAFGNVYKESPIPRCSCVVNGQKYFFSPFVTHCGDIEINGRSFRCPKDIRGWSKLLSDLNFGTMPSETSKSMIMPWKRRWEIGRIRGEEVLAGAIYNLKSKSQWLVSEDFLDTKIHSGQELIEYCLQTQPKSIKTRECKDSIARIANHFNRPAIDPTRFIPRLSRKDLKDREESNPEVLSSETFQYGFKVSDRDYMAKNLDKIGFETVSSRVSFELIKKLRRILTTPGLSTDGKNQQIDQEIEAYSTKDRVAIRLRATPFNVGTGARIVGRLYLYFPGAKCDRHIQLALPYYDEIDEIMKNAKDKKKREAAFSHSQVSQVVVCHHGESGPLRPNHAYIRDYFLLPSKEDSKLALHSRLIRSKRLDQPCLNCHTNGYIYFDTLNQNSKWVSKIENMNRDLRSKYATMIWAYKKGDKIIDAWPKTYSVDIGVSKVGSKEEALDQCLSWKIKDKTLRDKLLPTFKEVMNCNDCHNGVIERKLRISAYRPHLNSSKLVNSLIAKRHPIGAHQKLLDAWRDIVTKDKSGKAKQIKLSQTWFYENIMECLVLSEKGFDLKPQRSHPINDDLKIALNCSGEDLKESDFISSLSKRSFTLKGKALFTHTGPRPESLNKDIKDNVLVDPELPKKSQIMTSICTGGRCKRPVKAKVFFSGNLVRDVQIDIIQRYDVVSREEIPFEKWTVTK